MSFHHLTVALALATSLAFAGCKKKDPPAPAPAPASSGDTAAAPQPGAAAPSAAPAAAKSTTPAPALPNHDVADDDATGEEPASQEAAAETGTITNPRRLASIQNRANRIHHQFDANQDGKLSPEELASARGRRARFDDPFALDTDHDGDISPDELAAGLKARAEARRAEILGAKQESK